MRLRALLLLALLLVPGPALARSKHRRARAAKVTAPVAPPAEPDVSFVVTPIVASGVARFDAVFAPAVAMTADLESARANLVSARSSLMVAMGIEESELTSKAMVALKAAAGAALQVDNTGAVPRLSATAPVADNVRAGIDAVNRLLDAATSTSGVTVTDTRRIAAAAEPLPDQAAAMAPTDPRGAAVALAAINNNTRTLSDVTAQADALARLGARIISDARTVFGSAK